MKPGMGGERRLKAALKPDNNPPPPGRKWTACESGATGEFPDSPTSPAYGCFHSRLRPRNPPGGRPMMRVNWRVKNCTSR